MELVTPDLGLIFWTGIVFCILLFLLAKFAWKPILGMVNEREQKIANSLEQAEKAQVELQALKAQNEDLLKEARAERDAMIKDAKLTAAKMVDDAKLAAKEEGLKMMEAARQAVQSEKVAAIAELKTQMAAFSIEIAEKIVRGELASSDKQKALAEKLVEDINMN